MQLSLSHRTGKLIAVAAFAVIAVGCNSLTSNGNGSETYGLVAIPLDEYWSTASETAVEWRADAYISRVTIDIELPNSPASGSNISFSIESPGENMVTLTVACSEDDCKVFEVDRNPGHPLAHCRAIELEDPDISSQEALAISLANGGRQYVYNENAIATMYLAHSSDNLVCSDRLTWRADFFEPATFGIDVLMDAKTGEILEYP